MGNGSLALATSPSTTSTIINYERTLPRLGAHCHPVVSGEPQILSAGSQADLRPRPSLSHDARSSQSQQALALIRQAQRGSPHGSNANTNTNDSSSTVFLKEAASPASSSLDLQLEVRERQKEPPTPGQIRTILEYLKASPSSSLAGAVAAAAAQAGAAPESHPAAVGGGTSLVAGSKPGSARPQGAKRTRVKAAQQQPDDASNATDESSVARRLESSPLLLVDWDAGRASTDLAGVQEMIERWREEQASGKRSGGASSSDEGGRCVVM